MRLIISVVALLFSVDRFVITEKLPAKPQPHHESIPDDAGEPAPSFVPEPDRFTGPIEWNLDRLASVQAVESSEKVIGYAPVWCKFCPQAKEVLGNGDETLEIEWRTEECPQAAWKFADGSECGYPCLYYEKGNKVVRGLAVKSVEHLRETLGIKVYPQAHVSAISAGAIDKSFVDTVANLLRPGKSSITCGNEKQVTFGGSVTLTFPARVGLTAETSGNVTTIKFSPKPTLSWGRIVSQSIDGLTYDGERVTLNLPWCPDLTLDCRSVCESPEVSATAPRSPKWPTVRKHFLEKHPACEACGKSTGWIECHHCEPFHENPARELDESNLITLCRDHHFHIGHDPDYTGPELPSWSRSNPNVRQDAKTERAKHGRQGP